MLAAIIANLQNVQPQERPQLPTVKIDRGGGGQSWPHYDIVDIIAAAATFVEISGEDPITRAVRRHRWIGHALPFVKEARDKREATVFMAGAQLGAATERAAAMEAEMIANSRVAALAEQLSIEQMINKLHGDARRGDAPPAQPRGRGDSAPGGGAAIVIGLIVGVAIGAAIVGKRRRKR